MNIKLNRDQLLRITTMANQFPDVEHFNLYREAGGGIGYTVVVEFDLPEQIVARVDITDVKDW